MNKEVMSGILRSGLAAVGGWLASKGYASAEDAAALATNASAITGAATVLASAAWSWWSKRKASGGAKQ